MYRKPSAQMSVYDFVLPFGGRLKADNRWVKLAALVPWDEIEEKYAELFPNPIGNVAKPARVALGALLIKERCGFTDQETVEQISENPYLQYFLGFKEFSLETPFDSSLFDSSLMVHFRKRFTADTLNDINEMICELGQRKSKNDNDNDSDGSSCGSTGKDEVGATIEEPKNQGKLFLDATCAPADIRYPTDISLLNEAREKLEGIIDTLHEPLKGTMKKPRTYRKKARKQYLMAAKTRKPRGGIAIFRSPCSRRSSPGFRRLVPWSFSQASTALPEEFGQFLQGLVLVSHHFLGFGLTGFVPGTPKHPVPQARPLPGAPPVWS